MGNKNKKHRNRQPEPKAVKPPLWKRASAICTFIPVATILAFWGAAYGYKTTGAKNCGPRSNEAPPQTDEACRSREVGGRG